MWEWCSGSSRLTLTCCLAGLLVGFPVDYRYGWNIANPEHQQMLTTALHHFQPEVLVATPRCKFWSISASRRKWSELLHDREQERPTLTFIHKAFEEQVQEHRGYLLEQQDFQGWRRAKRTDQCGFVTQS